MPNLPQLYWINHKQQLFIQESL